MLLQFLHQLQRFFFLMSAAFLLISPFDLYPGIVHRRLVAVDLADLEAGKPPGGMYLELRGEVRWDLAVARVYGDDASLLVPVVSPEWKPRRPIAVYIEVLSRDGPVDRASREPGWTMTERGISGVMVNARGIGPSVAEELKRLGVPPTPDAFLFDPGTTPNRLLGRGLLWLVGSAVMLLGGLGMRWLHRQMVEQYHGPQQTPAAK